MTDLLKVNVDTFIYVGAVESYEDLPTPLFPFAMARDLSVRDGLALWIYDETHWVEKPELICMTTDLPEFDDLHLTIRHPLPSLIEIYCEGVLNGQEMSVQINAIKFTPTESGKLEHSSGPITSGRMSSSVEHISNIPKADKDESDE